MMLNGDVQNEVFLVMAIVTSVVLTGQVDSFLKDECVCFLLTCETVECISLVTRRVPSLPFCDP